MGRPEVLKHLKPEFVGNEEQIRTALALDGSSLEDYDPTVFAVVDGRVVGDSETIWSAMSIVRRAWEYGESNCFVYEWKGHPIGNAYPWGDPRRAD